MPMPSPVCCQQVPGNIRRAEHFVQFLRRFLEYLRQRMGAQAVEQETPSAFLASLQEAVAIDGGCSLLCHASCSWHSPPSCRRPDLAVLLAARWWCMLSALQAHLEEVSRCRRAGKTLRFCYDRLTSLLKTLEITDTDEFNPIHLVADFATLVGTYARGFAVIIEPFDERLPSVPDPVIQVACSRTPRAVLAAV